MERDFKGIWIPKEVWLNPNLTMTEKLFLVEIDSLNNADGCFASNDYFSEFFGLSKNRCSEIIKALERKEVITIYYEYKKGTKSIEKRIIKVVEISKRGTRDIDRSIRNVDRGYSENREDNNTILNNTINNIDTISKDIVRRNKFQPVIDKWNELGLQKIMSINTTTTRYNLLQARIKGYGQDKILEAIDSIKQSSFLRGQNKNYWIITFDWLIKPDNFIKVLEGNYLDKEKSKPETNNSKKFVREDKRLKFDNFEPRKYDYDVLENKLLGWDTDD